MRRRTPGIAAALGIAMLAVVPTLAAEWSFAYRQALVRYVLYGGGLADPQAPAGGDRKVAFEISGRAANEVFESIGPDRTDPCGLQPGDRFRSRDEGRLVCVRSRSGQTLCTFGFDLASGRSIGGGIC